ncbi:Structural maintenance of chromosomes protein 6 [Elasticomyces elasticus]|nr:Structural maintenance of chromosomes protein 6 [Elasticomyces elasticus]KAK3646743.1 Structural maintenance of chromosomes protein 6 [Elasticomyces elasticus]KAK4905641.1 Structural maintenance of chromosomes protein 6 [Elasticomyces elasticus]KAK5749052.1 Structural maintenance of chromosomes protein 6 [Elasticomyces elasticus]
MAGIFSQFRSQAPRNISPTPSTSFNTNMSTSSRKRARENTVEEEVEIESATSSFRHNFPKRSRLSLAADNGGSVVSDDEDEDEEQATNGAYDTLNDDGSVHSIGGHLDSGDDDDSDFGVNDLIGTQILEKQMRQHKENMASEEGVIEEVFCRNFMCHTKLRIKLGPLINFIIGHNGSGKSAVLTALTVCLGESARKTNRGGNLKGMIKEGQESATLAVKIKNRGEGAYKPELYGASITIERNFSRSGSNNGYKIKSSEDKTITTKKADLDDLLDFFSLQIDNPINVLTQDLARQFLSNSTPVDKYKFFIRGTRLEDLDRDYNIMEENHDKISAKLASRKEDIPELKNRYDQAEAKRKRLTKAETIRRRLQEVSNQHAWAQVAEVEDKVEQYNETVERAKQSVLEAEEESVTKRGTYEGHNQAFETSERLVETLTADLVPLAALRQTEKEQFDAARAEVTNVMTGEREIRDHLKNTKKRVKDLETDLKAERDRIAGQEGEEHGARLDKLEELKAAVETAKREHQEHAEKLDELIRLKDQTYQAYENAKGPRANAAEELRDAERSLAEKQRGRGRPFDNYFHFQENLVNAIRSESRWRVRPVGPMGQHIRLKDPKWSTLLESTFGKALESYVVTNNEDFHLLRDVMRRAKIKPENMPNIFTGDPDALDTTGKTPAANLETIMSVLVIDNTLVRNTLIINQGIDQVVLIEDRNEAQSFMFDPPTKPHNVKAVMCKVTNGINGLRLERTNAGNSKTSPVHGWKHARMQTDHESGIRHQQGIVSQFKRSHQDLEQVERQKRDAMTRAGQDVKRWERDAQALKTAYQRAEDAVEAQKNDIERNKPQDGKMQELERQLTEAKDDLDGYGASFQDAVTAKDKTGKASKAAKDRLDAEDEKYNAAAARLEEAKENCDRLNKLRQGALLVMNKALEDVAAAETYVTQAEQKRDAEKNTLIEYTTEATKISRRVPLTDGTTTKQLDVIIDRLNKDIAQQERSAGGNAEELALQWQKAKKEYDDAVSSLEGAEIRRKHIFNTLGYRRKRWNMFRKMISYRARTMFRLLLHERGFRGQVLIDHRAKELDVNIEPDSTKLDESGRSAKGLSGGEKSFSTICLLLSVWEAMGSPIRCLDEFDVFMDSVNRSKSVEIMMQVARRAVGRQFILITPQSMDNVTMGDDVRVHKMSDPERGQGVLPFTQG